MNNITCIRAPRDSSNPWFQTNRHSAQDLSMCLEARGLMWYILSLPSDWIAHPMQLAKANKIGKDKIYKLINILIENGYCQRNVTLEKGRHVATTYVFYEVRQLVEKPDSRRPETPLPEKPHPAAPDPENKDITEYTDTNRLQIYTNNTPPIPPMGEADSAACVCSSESKELTEEIIKVLKEMKPTCDIPKQKTKWHKASQKLIDRGISKADILKVLRWALNDNTKQGTWTGWSGKIWAKSNKIEYLNEKFDTLEEHMLTKPEKRKFLPCSDDAKALEEWNACGVEIE